MKRQDRPGLQSEFKSLRRQTTCFCTLVTGAIFLIMTLFCLKFSESSLRESRRQSFLSDVNSLISHLESQPDLSEQWLARMESDGKLKLFLFDNSEPLLHNRLPGYGRDPAAMDALAQKAIATARAEHGLDIFGPGMLARSAVFALRDEDGKELYAAAAVFPRQGGSLSMVAIYPLASLQRQLDSQRRSFALMGLIGLAALGVFAWIFSGRMLRPVAASRRSQSQFVAAASHELRSPLAVMLSNLSALDMAEPQEQRRFKDNILAEGSRMSRLIDSLLSLASADSQALSLRMAPAEPDTLAIELYDRFLGRAGELGLSLDLDLPEGNMKPLMCDAERISQALEALLDNALSYTPKGGSVLLSVEELPGGRCRFMVRDNGPGVPKEERERIFQRFYRADSSRTDREHFGLGLCIAREIVRLHRGKLWVQDAPGGGAEFHLVV